MNGKFVFKYFSGIKDYFWFNSWEIVIYKEEDLMMFFIVNIVNDDIQILAINVGFCMLCLFNGNFVYVQKSWYDDWKIMEKNFYCCWELACIFIEILFNVDYFVVLFNGFLIMGKGSKLYQYNKFIDDNWMEVVDLWFYEIWNIIKVIVSFDFQVVVVVD